MEVKELKKEKHWREANDPKREGRERDPYPGAFCMNIKTKGMRERQFA